MRCTTCDLRLQAPLPSACQRATAPPRNALSREAAALLAAEAALCLSLGALAALPLSLGVAGLVLLELARREPELNLGHRAGAEGYSGAWGAGEAAPA